MAIAADCKSTPSGSVVRVHLLPPPINQVVDRGYGCAAIADLASFSPRFPWSL